MLPSGGSNRPQLHDLIDKFWSEEISALFFSFIPKRNPLLNITNIIITNKDVKVLRATSKSN